VNKGITQIQENRKISTKLRPKFVYAEWQQKARLISFPIVIISRGAVRQKSPGYSNRMKLFSLFVRKGRKKGSNCAGHVTAYQTKSPYSSMQGQNLTPSSHNTAQDCRSTWKN
jgi:hypothetical protein